MKELGTLEVVAGCMFAGKTEELIRHANTLARTNHKFSVIKPSIDNRYSTKQVVSHDGNKVMAIEADTSLDILNKVDLDTQAILIDEAQFFDNKLVDVCEHLMHQGIDIVAVGLDMDFRGQPFETMSSLLAKANQVNKISSYCAVCGKTATRTQRLINGKPASFNDPVVLIGAQESYEPRCHQCHEVIDIPNFIGGNDNE